MTESTPSSSMDASTATVARGSPAGERSAVGFREFVAYPTARTLMLAGEPVCLGSRAFDLLMLLLASRGEVVSKAAIMEFVWPTTTVDESNLRFQMGVLRKALGQSRDIIKTIPGRGYLLAGDVPAANTDATGLDGGRVETVDRAEEGSREIRNALCALLDAVGRHSSALPSVQALVSEIVPADCGEVLVTSSPHWELATRTS